MFLVLSTLFGPTVELEVEGHQRLRLPLHLPQPLRRPPLLPLTITLLSVLEPQGWL